MKIAVAVSGGMDSLCALLALREAGAVIMPFSPGFYLRPQSLEEMLLQTSGRIFDQLGLAHTLARWTETHMENEAKP